ncbi:MAG: hypothetical protein JO060_01090 [Candidatus Eremiobacteraeota bacterium]|nr:hypothetical protein [Candidatus Eremiobacteraeota bacterium]
MRSSTARSVATAAALVPALAAMLLRGGAPASSAAIPDLSARSVPHRSAAAAPLVPSIALPAISRAVRALMPRPAVRRPPQGKPTTAKWIYTAQLYGDDLGVYQQGDLYLTFFESLTSGISSPQGTVSTRSGWWYVTNGGASDVLVYQNSNQGPIGPTTALQDAGEIPANVDVSASRRLVAVSNVSSTSGGSGSVSIYLNRSVIVSRTLTYGSDALQGIGVALDPRGDCFWSFNDETLKTGSVVEFNGCIGSGMPLVSGLNFAGGITFDQQGNLYYIDQMVGIYKCKKLSNCALLATGFGDPVNINFDQKGKDLWVADATGYIDAVDPTTGTILYQTKAVGGSSDPPFGVAAAPGVK